MVWMEWKMLSNNIGTNNLGNMLNNLRRKIEEIMSVKIRLSRHGAKKDLTYRIVVADVTPRDGKFIEKVGTLIL